MMCKTSNREDAMTTTKSILQQPHVLLAAENARKKFCVHQDQLSEDLANFYWDTPAAIYKLKDAAERKIRAEGNYELLGNLLELACEVDGSGISLHIVEFFPDCGMDFGYMYDFDQWIAGEIADFIDDLCNGNTGKYHKLLSTLEMCYENQFADDLPPVH